MSLPYFLTLVKSPEQPAGSHPPSSPALVSYSGASTVTVVNALASTEAAPVTGNIDSIVRRTAVRASILVIVFLIDGSNVFVLLAAAARRQCRFRSLFLLGDVFLRAG